MAGDDTTERQGSSIPGDAQAPVRRNDTDGPPAAGEVVPGSVALSLASPSSATDEPDISPHVARVRAFVNTREIDGDDVVEGLASPADLAAWLTAHGLLGEEERLDDDDVREAIEVREAIRGLLERNAGHGMTPGALGVLEAAAARSPMVVRFAAGGSASVAPVAPLASLVPVGGGLAAALGRLFADIATAMAEGSWARLKACHNDECRWAYYDVSRNRSGRWCSMAGCGNRMKGRAYRARSRSSPGSPGSTD